jgi:hypothetical protein
MHNWTIQIAFVECDAVTSGLKCSDVSVEHGASIFRIPSGGHIQYVCPKHRYSTRLHDITFWKTDHDKYPKLAVSRILSARTDQDTEFSHGVACDDCWKVTQDWQTDDKKGRCASEMSDTISLSTLDNMKGD